MKHRVLLIEPTIQPVGVNILNEHCDVYMAPDGKEETLIQKISESQAEGVVTRVEQITEKIINSCPSLKVIAQHGTGYDGIDVAAATKRGIKVLNLPDQNYIPVAEHIMMFALMLSRNAVAADQEVRSGNWRFREANIPSELIQKTLFLIGIVRIGREVTKKAHAFHMNVISYDPFVPAEQMEASGAKKIEKLEDGLRQADFISIQLHLTEATRGMIAAPQFQIMKNTAYLINLSRGPILNQPDICEALRTHQIAGAALDVMDPEPPQKDDPLFSVPNLIVTPHLGGDTYEAKQRISSRTAETLIRALNGEATYNWVNRTAMESIGTAW